MGDSLPDKQEPLRVFPVHLLGCLNRLHTEMANVGDGVYIIRGAFFSILSREFALVKRHAGEETEGGAEFLLRRVVACYIGRSMGPKRSGIHHRAI